MPWTNFHSHCHYCDGKMSPEENLLAAIEQGVTIYGFSSHCPVPFSNAWSIRLERLPEYLREIEALKEKYHGQIEVYKSLEIDYIPNLISPKSEVIREAKLDYTLGSVHFVGQFKDGSHWEIDGTTQRFKTGLQEIYRGNIKHAVSDYFMLTRKMVEEARPDIVGHMDKIKMHNTVEHFFNENESWYQDEALKTLEVIKASGAVVEVNTRGIYKKKTPEPYPGKWMLKEIQKMGIPICLNSDSHHPTEITKEFSETALLLQSLGFKEMWIIHNKEWMDVEFDERGLKF